MNEPETWPLVVLSPAAAPTACRTSTGHRCQSAASRRPVQPLHGQFPHMAGEQRPGQLIPQITAVVTGDILILKATH